MKPIKQDDALDIGCLWIEKHTLIFENSSYPLANICSISAKDESYDDKKPLSWKLCSLLGLILLFSLPKFLRDFSASTLLSCLISGGILLFLIKRRLKPPRIDAFVLQLELNSGRFIRFKTPSVDFAQKAAQALNIAIREHTNVFVDFTNNTINTNIHTINQQGDTHMSTTINHHEAGSHAISGSNNNIGVIGNNSQITNASFNQQTSNEEAFAELRDKIATSVLSAIERQSLLDKIIELEKTKNTPTFIEKYKEFMQLAANHTTCIAPFIPMLSNYLR